MLIIEPNSWDSSSKPTSPMDPMGNDGFTFDWKTSPVIWGFMIQVDLHIFFRLKPSTTGAMQAKKHTTSNVFCSSLVSTTFVFFA